MYITVLARDPAPLPHHHPPPLSCTASQSNYPPAPEPTSATPFLRYNNA